MKLVRFELAADPSEPKSGFIHGGRVYETDGENPIAVHEPDQVRLLPPVQPPAIRIFDLARHFDGSAVMADADSIPYVYANPYALYGPNAEMRIPDFATQLGVRVCLAAVCHQAGRIEEEEADDVIIGYSLVLSVFARSELRKSWSSRAFDFGLCFGPALTTPDELEPALIATDPSHRFSIPFILRVNGVEMARGTTETLPISLGQAAAAASQSVALRSGDVIAVGPLHPDDACSPSIGDEISVTAEGLGSLFIRLTSEEIQ